MCCHVFKECCCYKCFLYSYLHVYVRDIKNFKVRGDINIAGTNDLYVKLRYQGVIQETKVLKKEKSDAVFDEPLILEHCSPNATEKLHIEIYDEDTVTSDDKLASAEIDLPTAYAQNVGEKQYPLLHDGKDCGSITLDQIHFVHQKLIRYTGPCKCCCCCLDT